MSEEEIKEYNVMLNNEQVKVLVDELKEKDREIERLQKLLDIEKNKREQFDKNNQLLHSIIKEVKKYLDIDESIRKTCKRYDVNGIAILEILDKESKLWKM